MLKINSKYYVKANNDPGYILKNKKIINNKYIYIY